jgi:hypothetical protein
MIEEHMKFPPTIWPENLLWSPSHSFLLSKVLFP